MFCLDDNLWFLSFLFGHGNGGPNGNEERPRKERAFSYGCYHLLDYKSPPLQDWKMWVAVKEVNSTKLVLLFKNTRSGARTNLRFNKDLCDWRNYHRKEIVFSGFLSLDPRGFGWLCGRFP